MKLLVAVVAGITGYLWGSISFARRVGKLVAPEVDLTRIEQPVLDSDMVFRDDAVSASTVLVNVGSSRYGCLTGVLDMLKAAVPTFVWRRLAPQEPYYLIAAAMAVVGHNWPLYHRFKGGRGESTIYGGMLVVDPVGPVICNLAAMVLGWVSGSVRVTRFAGMALMIPWMALRRRGWAPVAYIAFVNACFWFTMRNELKQHYQFQRGGALRSQADVSEFMEMGRAFGTALDKYGLPALMAGRGGSQPDLA
jgi:glycerol-3-phosphate acyltransferase PlsY